MKAKRKARADDWPVLTDWPAMDDWLDDFAEWPTFDDLIGWPCDWSDVPTNDATKLAKVP